MSSVSRGLALALGALAVLLCSRAAFASTVSTLAGSGRAGIADGPSGAATFLLPTGVAWGSGGQLYVADAAAQRIREVRPDGQVETLAGSGAVASNGLWVKGGYADGNGTAAAFNFPSALAVGLHGEIYVADTYNHCIRLVSETGHVTTYAGSPQRQGDDNGDRHDARFMLPRSVAVDRLGDLYIADPLSGVRRITHNGVVSTIPLPANAPYEVAVSPTGAPELFVTNNVGLWVIDLSSFNGSNNVVHVSRYFAGPRKFFSTEETKPQTDGILLRAAEGEESIGYPFAISAFDENSVVYTDLRTHTVRFLDTTYQQTFVLGGQPIEDAANYGGGFSDGSTARSRFDAPMGIAVRRDGAIAVADSGNKRIRIIRGVDRTEPLYPAAQILPASAASTDYRIAYIGNSFVWTNSHAADSIGGLLQRQLERDGALSKAGKHPRVITVRMSSTFGPLEQYVSLVATTHAVDAVVLQLNSFFASFSFNLPLGSKNLVDHAGVWQSPMLADLVKMKKALKGAGIPLLIISHPLGDEISLAEQPYATLESPTIHVAPDGTLERLFNGPISAAGVPWLDMWGAFQADVKSARHKPLFLAIDGHFTPHGEQVMAKGIAAKLEAMRPWRR